MSYKVGFLTTHPIQYQVPVFQELSKIPEIDLTVFYCMIPDEQQQGDGFGVKFTWDVPLLEGYTYEVLENVAKEPSVTKFTGCDTPGIWGIVRDRGFDACIVNGWVVKSCIQLLMACRRYGVPCIVRGESNAMRPRSWQIKIIHRVLLKQYSAFLAIGKSNMDFYLNYGIPQEKIFGAPYGVDNEKLGSQADALASERDRLRAAWKIPIGATTFLYCAKFIGKKRPLDLMEAFSLALQRTGGEGIHLLMVGDGELRHECERIADERKLPVTFAGFLNQSEIVSAYVASDCLILPSDYGETWGLVVNEAMACGLPAIVSDRVGCHPDLIRPGQTGEIFPFGDIKALAGLIASYDSKTNRLADMGRKAQELIRRYSVSEVVLGCTEALRYICGHKN